MINLFRTKKTDEELPIERLSKLEKKILRLEAEILDVATAQTIIRDKVLRKIQFKKEEKEEETEEDTFKGIPKAKHLNISSRIGL